MMSMMKTCLRITLIRGLLLICLLLCARRATLSQSLPQGFFLNDATSKTAVISSDYNDIQPPTKTTTATVTIDPEKVVTPVSKYLFGNNANIWMTQMVDQPDLLASITDLSPNVIRFPGGNNSSVYFWNANKNQPPLDAPAKLVDANGVTIDAGYWYGKNSESWTMSVDNYYSMLQKTNSTGIITVNYSYARYSTATDPVASAAHLAAEWVRYDNGRTKFWEIGNESNGTWQAGFRISTSTNKDGQPEIITGELYGKHFKVFADSMRKAASERGVTIYIGAQLLAEAPASWWNNTDRTWNTGVFQQSVNSPDYYIIHSYYTPYQTNSTAIDILNTATSVTKSMMDYVTTSVAQAGLTAKPVALTEWNIFAEGSKQQTSYVNGMHAAITLGELLKNKYGLACRWDLANGWSNGNDHGMFSQGDEPGVPRWNARAVFYYMYFFQKYFGDHMVEATVTGNPNVLAYASKFSSGQTSVVLVNKSSTEQTISLDVKNFGFGNRYYYHTLTGGSDNGEFSLKVFVNNLGPLFSSGGPSDFKTIKPYSGMIGGGVKVTSPPKSVQYVLIENGSNVITSIASESRQFAVYPNPSTGTFEVVFSVKNCQHISVIDQTGKIVMQVNETFGERLEIKRTFAKGIYTIVVRKDNHIFTHRLVID
jgi:hypothetical protein